MAGNFDSSLLFGERVLSTLSKVLEKSQTRDMLGLATLDRLDASKVSSFRGIEGEVRKRRGRGLGFYNPYVLSGLGKVYDGLDFRGCCRARNDGARGRALQ